MQVTVNSAYVANRARIGAVTTILGLAVLGVGMYISLQSPTNMELAILPWFTLGLGIILLNIGKFHQSRYGTRLDRALAQNLKAFDSRHHLYSYVKDLPVEHLLSTPYGLFVLEARPHQGEIINEGDKWSRPVSARGFWNLFTDPGLGNPSKDAEQDVAAVRKMLRERLGEKVEPTIPVAPVVVFTHPRVKLRVSESTIPVVTLSDLRGALRKQKEGGRIAPEVQRQLARALGPSQETQERPQSTSRSKPWQRTQKSSLK